MSNYFVVTTDWHVTSDGETGGTGEIQATPALALARHINALSPDGVISLGDNKDHYGLEAAVGDEEDLFNTNVAQIINWKAPNAGVNATKPLLPGNHDEILDSTDEGATDFSIFTTRFWAAPFHWTVDWTAAQIRFIGIHTYIIHSPEAHMGGGQIDATERTWLSSELASLPAGYKAIVVSHFPLVSDFGNEVQASHGGTELLTILSDNASQIACCVNGHRHTVGTSYTVSGILHINAGGTSYITGDAAGAFLLLEYAASAITVHLRSAGGLFGEYAAASFTPIVVSL